MRYFKLTDTINKDTVVRINDQSHMPEVYNAAYDTWDIYPEWLRYTHPGDVYEGLFVEIAEADVPQVIKTYSNRWKTYWNVAQSLVNTQYKTLASPIKNLSYEKYVYILVDLADNERERVMLALSGMPLLSNWEDMAKRAHFTKPMIEGLKQWHKGTKQLCRISNQWVRKLVIEENRYLLTRNDLIDKNAVVMRYNTIVSGFTREEIYSEVL